MVGAREEPPRQGQQNRARPPRERCPQHDANQVDQAILSLLLFEPGVGPWAVDELVREIRDRIDVDDSLWRLSRAGLIHRLGDGFVFASRAAARAAALLDPESVREKAPHGPAG